MKKGVVILGISLFLINFASAQFYDYRGYNYGFSFDLGTLVPVALFAIIMVLVALPLSRLGLFQDAYGKPRGGLLAVISSAVSFLAVYGMYQNFDIESFFFGFGGISYPVVITILVLGFILLWWLLGLGKTLVLLGLGLIALALFTDIFFEDGTVLFIGFAMVVAGGVLWWWKRRKGTGKGFGKIICLLTILVGLIVGYFGVVGNNIWGIVIGLVILGLGMWCLIRKKKPIQPRPAPPGQGPGPTPPPGPKPGPTPPTGPPKKQRTEQEKFNLARKIGIKNLEKEYSSLQKEYESGVKNAEKLHRQATKHGWTKTKEGNEYYKAWYRQYNRLDVIRKRLAEIQQRIKHLGRQLK